VVSRLHVLGLLVFYLSLRHPRPFASQRHVMVRPTACALRTVESHVNLYCRDSQVHTQLVQEFEQHVQQQGADLRGWTGPARMCALAMLLHMCDIANVAKPLDLAARWAGKVSIGELVKICAALVRLSACQSSRAMHTVYRQLSPVYFSVTIVWHLISTLGARCLPASNTA
jgi:hypothetical protein